MALYAVRPCSKCKRNHWRLISVKVVNGQIELTCIYCGDLVMIPERPA
jgi:hypothetical protein